MNARTRLRCLTALLLATSGMLASAQPPPQPPYRVDPEGNLLIGPRLIPVPQSISPEARRGLRAMAAAPRLAWPSHEDKAAWRQILPAMQAGVDQIAAVELQRLRPAASVQRQSLGGVGVYVGTPVAKPAVGTANAHLTLHGGAFVTGGGKAVAADAAQGARWCECPTYSVDFRMPPDHPYPAAVDDGVAAYRELIKRHDPKRIVLSGISSGANLAAAITLRVRDAGLPLPGALVLLSPQVDLTESGDTFQTNRFIDVVLKDSLREPNLLYAAGRDLKDPYVSPLFADFSKGFPPTFIQSGTRDMFLSNAVRLHRALRGAGIDAELHVWEALPHGTFSAPGAEAPDTRDMESEMRQFVDAHLGHPAG